MVKLYNIGDDATKVTTRELIKYDDGDGDDDELVSGIRNEIRSGCRRSSKSKFDKSVSILISIVCEDEEADVSAAEDDDTETDDEDSIEEAMSGFKEDRNDDICFNNLTLP